MTEENRNIVGQTGNTPERVSRRPVVSPAVDIFENTDSIVVVADLPGVSDGGVKLQFEKDELRIEATTTVVGDGMSPLFREFAPRDYRRTFQLAPGIDVDKSSADLKGGVLTITLPKAAALKPRRITIKPE